jgi:hypothetical protein
MKNYQEWLEKRSRQEMVMRYKLREAEAKRGWEAVRVHLQGLGVEKVWEAADKLFKQYHVNL